MANFGDFLNGLSRVHERYRRQIDRRQKDVSSRSLIKRLCLQSDPRYCGTFAQSPNPWLLGIPNRDDYFQTRVLGLGALIPGFGFCNFSRRQVDGVYGVNK